MVLNFPKQAGSSRQLRRIIAGRATLGFFVLSTAVAIASMAPLALQLLKGEERNLSFALSTRTLAVEEYLTRAQDLGQQIASRTRARQILEDYEAGDVNFGRVVEVSGETLPPALDTSEDAAGLVRLTRENEPVGAFGVPISPTLWAIPPLDTHKTLINGPIEIDNTRYLVISTPILNPTKERVGTDILLFKVDNLKALVEDYTGLGETGEMVLGQLIEDQFELVFPLRHQDRPSEELTQDLRQAIQNKQDQTLATLDTHAQSEIIVYKALESIDWSIGIKMDKQELYAPVKQKVLLTILIIIIGILLISYLFRPILNRVTDVEDLEQQVVEKEDALKQLQQAQARLVHAEKMSSLGQLVAGIAHEINNPVNFIHGNINIAQQYSATLLEIVHLYQQEYPHPSESITHAVEAADLAFIQKDCANTFTSMRNGTTRIRDIVQSLRTFSRLDEADLKTVDLHEGIESVLMLLQNRLTANSHELRIQVNKQFGDLPLVECYSNQLNQVFFNILTNAIDALRTPSTPSRSADTDNPTKPTIALIGQIDIITQVVDSNWVEIQIADDGPGIDQAVQSKIFDPFFTTKTVGAGTGMGLAMSYNIVVDDHQGQLICESVQGQGCKFTIKIPVHQPSRQGQSQSPNSSITASHAPQPSPV